MKKPAIASILLCLVIYTVQGLIPCGVCSIAPCSTTAEVVSCELCQVVHSEELPLEPCSCVSVEELPIYWYVDQMRDLTEVSPVEHKKADTELFPRALCYMGTARMKPPPPVCLDWQPVYAVFLI